MRTWDLTLYASPDLRFLTGELMDTRRDPAEEERAHNEALMKGLTGGAAPTRGPADAPVTIVEFSDFQCPFCGKFSRILDEALASGAENVRVVFHHLPLGGHAWARTAAEGAACAQLQSREAFWSMHDLIFGNQEGITEENIGAKLSEFAAKARGLDAKAFQECARNNMSLGLVLRDMGLAEANQVNGTPTLFINGRRVQGVENAAQLRELIDEAGKDAAGAPAQLLD
jgi:protein-disulfide isomerase